MIFRLWRRWAISILVAVGFLSLQYWLAAEYIVVRPGPVAFVADLVHVDSRKTHGRNFMLASVYARRANVLDGVRTLVDSSIQLQPLRDHVPGRLRWSQYAEVLLGMMNESQEVAAAVALRQLGVRIEARLSGDFLEIDLPPGIHFRPSDFSGASAGLLYALEIYDQLTEGTLAAPYLVAGTGDLRLDGSVRSVEGVRQKVIAAERAGAHIFLVPRENLQEAVSAARSIRVIGVDTFAEAVRILARVQEEENLTDRRTSTMLDGSIGTSRFP